MGVMRPLALFILPALLFAQFDGTREYSAAALRTEPKTVWETKTGYRDSGAFALVAGVLVSGNINGTGGIFGYDATTGKRLWSIPRHMRGGPSTDGTAAYVVNDTGAGNIFRLLKLDPKTGRILWSASDEDFGNHNTAPVVADGRVFLANRNDTLAAVDAESGKVLWKLPAARVCSPNLAYGNRTLYFAGAIGEGKDALTALDPATGKARWATKTKAGGFDACTSGPALSGGLLLTIADRKELQAFDAATGAPKWQRALTSEGEFFSLAVSQGVAYSGSAEGFHGFRVDSGQPVFDVPFVLKPSGGGFPLLISDGVLYFVGNTELPADTKRARTGWIYALDVATKKILWKHHASRPTQYDPDGTWTNQHMLPVTNGLFYETEGLVVRLGQ